ncbi:MAG: RHS domain-containing protein [Cocleimonas sp.]|nr:RHS domain-containing protein [Cocleimonas sp.]
MNNLIKSILIILLFTIGASHSFAEKNQKFTFYHYDLLGSPVATTDETGKVTWREEYSPWGEKLLKEDKAHDNVRGYTGHVNDKETGLTYMQARYYDPQIGRFMGVDPIDFKESSSISFNRYGYANNNPFKFIDPNGEAPRKYGACNS